MFGKPLISQAVIRHKLAGMISRAESVQAWLENVTYQMCNMAYKEQAQKLAGYVVVFLSLQDFFYSHGVLITRFFRQIAFLKMYSTQSAQQTAQDAVQIFGGRGITQSGMGKFIEHVRLILFSFFVFYILVK